MAQFGTGSSGVIPTPAAAFEHPIALDMLDAAALPWPTSSASQLSGGASAAVQQSSGQPLALEPPDAPYPWPSKIVPQGTFYVYAENDADFTTSSTTPVNALSLTTEVLPPGDYLISTYGETTQNTTGASSTVDLELDGVDITATRNGAEVDTADSFPRPGFALRTFTTPAAHTLNLRIQVTTGSTTIRRRRILIQQLRPFKADGFRY